MRQLVFERGISESCLHKAFALELVLILGSSDVNTGHGALQLEAGLVGALMRGVSLKKAELGVVGERLLLLLIQFIQ